LVLKPRSAVFSHVICWAAAVLLNEFQGLVVVGTTELALQIQPRELGLFL
jgi:hypothetical protein